MKFTDRSNNQAAQTQHRSTYLQLSVTKWQNGHFFHCFHSPLWNKLTLGWSNRKYLPGRQIALYSPGWLLGWSVGRRHIINLHFQLCFSLSLVCCLPLKKNIFPSPNIFLLFLLRSLLPRGMISNFALFNSENLSFLQMQCKNHNAISLGCEVTIFLHTTIKRKAFPLPTFLFLSGNYIKWYFVSHLDVWIWIICRLQRKRETRENRAHFVAALTIP